METQLEKLNRLKVLQDTLKRKQALLDIQKTNALNSTIVEQPKTILPNNKLVGKITSIVNNTRNNYTFYVKSVSSDKEYLCKSDFYIGIDNDDFIDAAVYYDGTYCNLLKSHPPEIELNYQKESIINVFVKIMIMIKSPNFGVRTANKLFDYVCALKEGDPFMVSSYISEKSILYNQDGDEKHFTFLLNSNCNFTREKAILFLDTWYIKRELRKLYILGLTNRDIKNIDMCPTELYNKLKTNPYLVYKLTIEKAHYIKKQLNLNINDIDIKCGEITRFIYDKMSKNSWTYVPYNILKINYPIITNQDVLKTLIDEYKVLIVNDMCYLADIYDMETEFIEYIKSLIVKDKNTDKLEPIYKRSTLTDEQKAAIEGALNNNISIITGPGGAGKTTVIDELVNNLELYGKKFLLTSFTGKSVARIKEVIPTLNKNLAKTLHLCLHKVSEILAINPEYIIIDEGGTVSLELVYKVLRILDFNENIKIILLGDINQLPTISWGSFFAELLKSGLIPTYYLTINHRARLANNIINGVIYNAEAILKYDSEEDYEPFSFKAFTNFCIFPGNIDSIYQLVNTLKDKGVMSDKTIIISPFKKYLKDINDRCQTIYNEGNNYVESGGKIWYINDKVRMIENNYDINIMNGEEGIITNIEDNSISVSFSNGTTHKFKLLKHDEIHNPYENDDSEDFNVKKSNDLTIRYLCHNFGITVHSSQGSEYDYVIIYIPPMEKMTGFLDYRLMYTSITRAKKMVFLVGDILTMNNAATHIGKARYNNLTNRLTELF